MEDFTTNKTCSHQNLFFRFFYSKHTNTTFGTISLRDTFPLVIADASGRILHREWFLRGENLAAETLFISKQDGHIREIANSIEHDDHISLEYDCSLISNSCWGCGFVYLADFKVFLAGNIPSETRQIHYNNVMKELGAVRRKLTGIGVDYLYADAANLYRVWTGACETIYELNRPGNIVMDFRRSGEHSLNATCRVISPAPVTLTLSIAVSNHESRTVSSSRAFGLTEAFVSDRLDPQVIPHIACVVESPSGWTIRATRPMPSVIDLMKPTVIYVSDCKTEQMKIAVITFWCTFAVCVVVVVFERYGMRYIENSRFCVRNAKSPRNAQTDAVSIEMQPTRRRTNR